MSIKDKKKILISEDYNGDIQSSLLPTFEDKTGHTSKTQTDNVRHIHKESFTQTSNLSQLPVESDCGSLYPATGKVVKHWQITIKWRTYATELKQKQIFCQPSTPPIIERTTAYSKIDHISPASRTTSTTPVLLIELLTWTTWNVNFTGLPNLINHTTF